ncbi:hypothetical protein RRG08_034885 [Elysia crispata]|uniref:Uncharacterized protein n=1 Tax=Elysia crispata TaxID=231223 RepID=A0AAE1DMF3_9GAST|nr:hypothetical protein RRG08_034885 [Elysia crispata]
MAALAAHSSNASSGLDSLEQSLLTARNFYDSALAQLDGYSRDQILDGSRVAFELNKLWEINLAAYQGLNTNATQSDNGDRIQKIVQKFEDAKAKFIDDSKTLDDDELKAKAREELIKMNDAVDDIWDTYGFSG